MFNCSQTKFVEIILVLSVFFKAIFRLTNFSSDDFDFSSPKTGQTGSAQQALSALRAFQLCFSSNCFGDLYLWCEGRFLEIEDTPPPLFTPPLLTPPPSPHRRCCPTPLPFSPHCTPTPMATDEQPIAKNTQFYTNFRNFFQAF